MLERGNIVCSIAGHDKRRYYVVVEIKNGWAYIADGKIRKLEAPKRKNLRHLQMTRKSIELEAIASNKALRKVLEPMNQALKKSYTSKKEGTKLV